jgi:hypothetical protein
MESEAIIRVAEHGPKFCEAARVDSFFPTAPQAAYEQRTRWEHGYLMQMVKKVPALFREGLRGNWQAGAAGLDCWFHRFRCW